ncbi:MAG: UDP-N-acetylmuramoyl-L-alanine--D-glutamate ligase [Mariprofundaceae bacterium]
MNMRTAIIGMGKTGCAVARFLSRRGEACAAFDEFSNAIPEDIHMPLHQGALDYERLQAFDRLIVSPGISWEHPVLKSLRDDGKVMCGDLDLFVEKFEREMIAVTGTNGKTTVVTLIDSMLEVLPGGIDAAGNIGKPMLELLASDVLPTRVVLELSSFQLERAVCALHPNLSVLLNIQEDHVDMHVDEAAYRRAKLRIFSEQGEGDRAMLPRSPEWNDLAADLIARDVNVSRFGIVAHVDDCDAGLLLSDDENAVFWKVNGEVHRIANHQLHVHGQHQLLNMAVAAHVAATYEVSCSVVEEALCSFRGLPHRLQFIGSVAGKSWYNDSKATNPDAAEAAIYSFEQVLWICGGLRKGVDLTTLMHNVKKRVVHAWVIGSQTQGYAEALQEAGIAMTVVGNLKEAVALAALEDVDLPVLLSPAAASQDQFRDYSERGECFVDAVCALEAKA